MSDQDEKTPVRQAETAEALREHKRYATNWQCALSCPDWETAERIAVSNISKGGMFLRADRPITVGAQVQVTLLLPDDRKVELMGTVRHSTPPEAAEKSGRPPGIGVEMDTTFKNELMALVEIARLHQDKSTGEIEIPAEAPPPASKTGFPQGSMPKVVGIDFGVSYSAVTIAVDDTVYVIPDDLGRTQIPSVVHFPETGEPVVGWEALAQQACRPDLTVASSKRLLGRAFSDAQIAGYLHYAPYATGPGPNDAIMITCGPHTNTVVQICAMILRELAQMAQRSIGRPVTHAVITHPITFTDVQKESLSRAAKIAGLEVVATLHEPMAAAIAYGFGQAKRELVAVYDFGGGTFDFTVIDIVGNQLRVLISEGDDWLGGDDFDRKLADALANTFWRKTKIELRNRVVEYNRLVVACEQAKRTLSHQHAAELKLPDISDAKNMLDLEQRIERAAFERVCRPLFESSLQIVEQALGAIGLNPDTISRVILSGGISHVPFVRQGLESFFNRSIEPVVDAVHAIALGAGLYAARMARHPAKQVQSLSLE